MSSPIVTVEAGARSALALLRNIPRTIVLGPASDPRKLPPRTHHPRVRPVQFRIQRIQQPRVHLELIVDLQRDVVLAVYRRREMVELYILVYLV